MTERLHFHFSFHALEKEMATHSSVLAWRIPGTGEPGGLSSIGSQSRTRLKRLSSSSKIALISLASKVMLKILQARLQQYVNHERPDVQAGFRKGRGTRDQIANIRWFIEKPRAPEKHLFLLY